MESCPNLGPGGASRGKESIIGWEGWGMESGYSRLQGCSPHLCQLTTTPFWPYWASFEQCRPHAGYMWHSKTSSLATTWASRNRYSKVGIRRENEVLGRRSGRAISSHQDFIPGVAERFWLVWALLKDVVRGVPEVIRTACWSGFLMQEVHQFESPVHSRLWVIACSVLHLVVMQGHMSMEMTWLMLLILWCWFNNVVVVVLLTC
jgi:hypothetical protein